MRTRDLTFEIFNSPYACFILACVVSYNCFYHSYYLHAVLLEDQSQRKHTSSENADHDKKSNKFAITKGLKTIDNEIQELAKPFSIFFLLCILIGNGKTVVFQNPDQKTCYKFSDGTEECTSTRLCYLVRLLDRQISVQQEQNADDETFMRRGDSGCTWFDQEGIWVMVHYVTSNKAKHKEYEKGKLIDTRIIPTWDLEELEALHQHIYINTDFTKKESSQNLLEMALLQLRQESSSPPNGSLGGKHYEYWNKPRLLRVLLCCSSEIWNDFTKQTYVNLKYKDRTIRGLTVTSSETTTVFTEAYRLSTIHNEKKLTEEEVVALFKISPLCMSK
ncbi:12989_t:CDS:2 [Funneliformis caledonium]|uniref:12989_t:CDS:1 n=1 Tax=Funneliformis caledonium TaxID=1117310 RepID=A0A9N8ZAP6_9GLOM|nr:12989_t:CDS:2 [Funneliformis caledonium]